MQAARVRRFFGQLICEFRLNADRVVEACRLVGQCHCWRGDRNAHRIPNDAWQLFLDVFLEEEQKLLLEGADGQTSEMQANVWKQFVTAVIQMVKQSYTAYSHTKMSHFNSTNGAGPSSA